MKGCALFSQNVLQTAVANVCVHAVSLLKDISPNDAKRTLMKSTFSETLY